MLDLAPVVLVALVMAVAPSCTEKPTEPAEAKPAAETKTIAKAETDKPAEAAGEQTRRSGGKQPAKPKADAKPRPSVTSAAVGPWVATLKPKRRTKRHKIDKAMSGRTTRIPTTSDAASGAARSLPHRRCSPQPAARRFRSG